MTKFSTILKLYRGVKLYLVCETGIRDENPTELAANHHPGGFNMTMLYVIGSSCGFEITILYVIGSSCGFKMTMLHVIGDLSGLKMTMLYVIGDLCGF